MNDLDFRKFDAGQPEQAKILLGKIDAYREFEGKHAGGSIMENIDHPGGSGIGEFTARAIAIYCTNR